MRRLHTAGTRIKSNPPPQKIAVVIVDMQGESVEHLAYRHGTAVNGIERMKKLIRCAREASLPIIFSEQESVVQEQSRTMSILLEEAKWRFIRIVKPEPSVFSNEDFDSELTGTNRDTLVVTGFNRIACVLATVSDALEKGYRVITSDELMFGSSNSDYALRKQIESAIRFYRRRTIFYRSSEELIAAICNAQESMQ
ncbi:MAG: isochorismatase family cysteine hydrolase [Candidatus Micrarchaeota archaeon]|nr:isochorismatase family cysteine hydrolase [Candidatus Micrarchaeota archaeon]